MSELISGKEALIALANGGDVQISSKSATLKKEWHDLYGTLMLSAFDSDLFEFRLKPRTITLNGIEVPAPFKPKKGDEFWYINPMIKYGFDVGCYGDNLIKNIQFGAWRTEEEIKQVVAALRKIFVINNP